MNHYSLPILVIASISFYVGIYHLMIYFRDRRSRRNLIFALLCFTTTLYDITCIGLYQVTSITEGIQWQRSQMAVLAFLIIFFVWFVADYTRYPHKRVIYGIIAFFLLAALFQLFDRSNLTWIKDQPSIKNIIFFNTRIITYYETAVGPITLLQGLMGLTWGIFMIFLGIRFYQQGHKQEAIPLIIAIVIMYLTMINDVAVSNEWYSSIYAIEYSYPIMILLMAFSLTKSFGDISLTQTALKESDIRYQTIIETSPDGIMITDLKGKIITCNQRILEMLGYENKKELVGTNSFDVIAPEDRTHAQLIFEKCAQSGSMSNEVFSVCKKDGSKFISEASATVVTNVEGKPISVVSISRDITDRIISEKTLQASESKYRALFEKSPVGQIITSGDNILLCNQAESQLFGYSSPQEMIGQPVSHFIHPDDYPGLADIGRTLHAGGVMKIPMTFKGVQKDGKPIIIETFSFHFPWEGENTLFSFHTDVTARKQTEEALRSSEAFLNDIIEQSSTPIFISDDKGTLIKINRANKELLQITDEMVVNKYNIFEDNVVQDAGFLPLVARVFEEKIPVRFELKYDTTQVRNVQTGEPRNLFLDVSISPILNADGKLTNAATQLIDITERKRAEEALRESEVRYRSLFFASSDAVFLIEQDTGRILDVNSKACDLYGYSREEMLQLTNVDMSAEPDKTSHALKTNLERTTTRYHKKKDGTIFPVDITASYFFQKDKKVSIAAIRDMTEHVLAEEALRESEERFRTVVESSPIGFFIINDISILEYANNEMSRILGYPLEEIVGSDFTKFLDEKSNDRVRNNYARRIRGEDAPKRYELGIIRKDGENRQTELGAALTEDSMGNRKVLGQMVDITERKKAEAEVMRLNEELEQRVINRTHQLESANSEMEAFTYSVSHDLRAPLRAIDGYARILLEDYSTVLDAEGQRLFSVIRDNSRKMSQLIDDLLAFSRLNRTEIRTSVVNMQELVDSVYKDLSAPEERDRIDIKIGALESITGDATLLRQVWSNLIANALKFSSKKEKAKIEIGCTPKESEIVYYVRDNGAGFDMHYVHQLFGVFHRLHNEKEFAGTGVGLAIVQRVIQRHNGRVWGKGEVDKGATFYFSLPKIVK